MTTVPTADARRPGPHPDRRRTLDMAAAGRLHHTGDGQWWVLPVDDDPRPELLDQADAQWCDDSGLIAPRHNDRDRYGLTRSGGHALKAGLPPTPNRNFRCGQAVWDRAMARAVADGAAGGLSGVLARYLAAYADGAPPVG